MTSMGFRGRERKSRLPWEQRINPAWHGHIALGSPVSLDYREKAPFKFNGKIEKVHIKYI